MLDDTTRNQLTARASNYRARIAAIRADTGLSESGKRAALATAYEEARDYASRVRGKAEESTASRKRQLEKSLFGLSPAASDSSVVALRDAQDRVAGISNPEQLGELMERALIAGDRTLLLAGFSHSYQQSRNPLGGSKWRPLLDEYIHEFPSTAEPLAELEELGGSAGLTAQLGEQIATGIPKPPELDRPMVSDNAESTA